jgi:quinol monooxygenase YgiN
VILIVNFTSAPGKRAELAAVINEGVALAHGRGCTAHRVATAHDDADALVLYEEWTSAEAHAAFMASGALSPFMQRMGALMAAPPDSKTYDVAAADPPFAAT